LGIPRLQIVPGSIPQPIHAERFAVAPRHDLGCQRVALGQPEPPLLQAPSVSNLFELLVVFCAHDGRLGLEDLTGFSGWRSLRVILPFLPHG
jgi:hypothetical protein